MARDERRRSDKGQTVMLTQDKDVTKRIETEREFHNSLHVCGENSRAYLNKYYVAISHGDQQLYKLVYELGRNRTVLEYGCADGTSAITEMRTPEYATDYYGIDISDVSIHFAQAKALSAGHKNCYFYVMDAEQMEFPDEKFDLIYGEGILHHLDLNKCFSEIRRTLKAGGTCIHGTSRPQSCAQLVSGADPEPPHAG